MQPVDPQLDHRPLPDLHDLLFDLLAWFSPRSPRSAPGGYGHPSPAAAAITGRSPACSGSKERQYDGFRRIIDDQVHPRGRFDGPDITAFPADDLALDLVTFQVEDGDGIFDGLLRGGPLDALDDDLPGLFIGFLLGVVDDLLLQGQGPGLGFLPEAFDQLATWLLRPSGRRSFPGGGYALPGAFPARSASG